MFPMNLLPVILIAIFSYNFTDVYEDTWLLLHLTIVPLYVTCLNRILTLEKGDTAFLGHYLPSLMTMLSTLLVLCISLTIRPLAYVDPNACDLGMPPLLAMIIFLIGTVLTVVVTYIFSKIVHILLKPTPPTN